jgi:hypothetical protein
VIRARSLRIDASGALGALALAIALGGYFAVVRPLEARIADRYRALDAARTAIDARRAVAAAARSSLEQHARLRAAIARFHLDAGRAASVDRFLGVAFAAANRHGAAIRALQAESQTARQATGPGPLFEEIPLQLTLRGSYAALLATVRDLAAAPIAARITIDALAPEDRTGSGPPRLLAGIGIVLLRAPAESHVRAEPRPT